MNFISVLLFCALAWHQPGKPDWQTGKADAISNTTHHAALAIVSAYYSQNEAKPAQEQPPKWYATSWAPEWALFFIGFGGVWVAISTLRHLRDSSERQLRAYVMPDNMGLLDGTMLTPPQPARFNIPGVGVFIKNYGQTPAYHVISWAQIAVISVGNEHTLTVPPMQHAFYNTLGPTGTFNKAMWFDRPLTPIEIADIAAGTLGKFLKDSYQLPDFDKPMSELGEPSPNRVAEIAETTLF